LTATAFSTARTTASAPLTTRDGLYTHAVYGFLTTLLRLLDDENPDALCVTFDVHAPTFRHTADAAYKATRKPMPQELRSRCRS
jgi:DNA polymerase-1